MRRRTFLFAIGTAAAGAAFAGDAQQQVFELFTKIAGALSEGDAAVFLDAVDPAMPNYQDFRRDVMALTALADLANSIEVLSDTGDETHRTEQLDWFLEIVNKAQSHTVERRRENVKFKLERKAKKWKIVSIEPPHFFGPPKAE